MRLEFEVDNSLNKKRLDMAILEKTGFSRSRIKNLIDGNSVLLNGKVVKAGEKLKTGQEVIVEYEELKPLEAKAEEVDFEIVYQDKDLLVINKPQGLVVHPCQSTKDHTLVNGLLMKVKDLSGINGVLRPGIVHRLDKNTSGLMVVAKNDMAHTSLASQIKDKTCKRKYLALLVGNLKQDEGVVETFLDRNPKDRKKYCVSESGRWAVSEYRVVKRFDKFCLVEFSLKTGRTHQIRVHASYLGHPVFGDDIYGKKEKGIVGQFLHSYKLEFLHPASKQPMSFEIPLPDYFQNFLNKL